MVLELVSKQLVKPVGAGLPGAAGKNKTKLMGDVLDFNEFYFDSRIGFCSRSF